MEIINKAVEELLPLLSQPKNPQVKSAALETLLGFTGNDDGCSIFQHHPALKCLACRIAIEPSEDRESAHRSLEILTNLTAASGDECEWLLREGPSDFCLSLWKSVSVTNPRDDDANIRDSASAVLCNLTHDSPRALTVWEKLHETPEVFSFDVLVDAVVRDTGNTYLADILANFSQLDNVRRQMTVEAQALKKILPFLDHERIHIRKRRGVASAIRNCCFEYDQHGCMLNEELELLPRLLLPLAGPEEFDDEDNEELPLDLQYLPPGKTREPSPEIRRMLVESIHQLCVKPDGRKIVKKTRGTYLIMRELHKWEKDARVFVALENLIDVLIGDETGEDYKQIPVPGDLQQKFANMDLEHMKDAESRQDTLTDPI